MKLKNIKITNYRCFKEADIDFDEHLTLIVGKNGAGKTAILDAVAVSASTFLLGIDGGVSRSILKDDARYEFHDLDGIIDPQHQFPVCVDSIGDCLGEQNIKWVRSLNSENGKTTIKDAERLTYISKKVQKQIMMGDKMLVLPLISYYGTGRLYAQKKEKRNIKSLTEFKRQVGYVDCMAAESNEKLMLNWFQMETLKSLQIQQKTGVIERTLLLKTVEKAICRSYERISGSRNASLTFDLYTHRIVLEFEAADGSAQKFAMDEMSDGYKNTLSMIGDIAYRMAVLNPTLGDRVLDETPGVVLIDEVDLHLHPQWQQTILSDLRTIFPNVQFIVSSHAPAVINSVSREQIRILDNGEIYMPVAQTYGRDANSILREVMNVSERPADVVRRLDSFYAYMDVNDYEKADKILTAIEKIVGTNDPDIAAARTSLDLEKILGE
ncbi:MAG: AAA family ATPase [Lachnospiraceae bacterium]|nr:AAA family ATPase [Lachnospiraceae bacterium]